MGRKLLEPGAKEKSDPSQQQRIAQELNTSVSKIQWVSAIKGIGMDALRQNIVQLFHPREQVVAHK